MREIRSKQILIPIILLALAVGVQCSRKVTEPETESGPGAFPTTIGSWWEYEVRYTRTMAWTPEDTTIYIDTVRVVVTDTVRTNSTGVLVAVVNYEPVIQNSFGLFDTLYYVMHDEESLLNIDTLKILSGRDGQYLSRGFINYRSGDISLPRSMVYSYARIDTTIVVPAGRFDSSIHFYGHIPGLHGYGVRRNDWIREGVGIVRSVYLWNDSAGWSNSWYVENSWTLLDYHIEAR